MKKIAKPTHCMRYLTVRGNTDFPIDMLRYDSCVPATETDAGLISRANSGNTSGPWTIVLRRFVEPGVREAESRRWESFGWTVLEESNEVPWQALNGRG